MIGEMLNGRYVVLDKIAEGGYAQVFRCETRSPVIRVRSKSWFSEDLDLTVLDVQDGDIVAVKCFSPESSLADFHHEVKALKRVQGHPGVVKLVDYFIDPKQKIPCIVMELLSGGDLISAFTENQEAGAILSEKVLSGLAKQMLETIAFVHSKGISNLDIKPENWVFDSMDDCPRLKIIDFGSCKIYNGDDDFFESFRGTLLYCAPELLKQYARLSFLDLCKCDMWSLGVLLLTIATGVSPFKRKRDAHIRQAIYKGEYIVPESRKVSKLFMGLIGKLINVDLDARLSAYGALEHPFIAQPEKVSRESVGDAVIEGLSIIRGRSKIMVYLARMLSHCYANVDSSISGILKHFGVEDGGSLEHAEVVEILRTGLDLDLSEATVRADELLESISDGKSRGLSAEDLKQIHAVGMLSKSPEAVESVFKELDFNKDGRVSLSDLVASIRAHRVSTPRPSFALQKMAEEFIKEVDTDNDGKISLQEFLAYLNCELHTSRTLPS
jgi:serine/threonine protein kinase